MFKTADTISVFLLVWRSFVLSVEPLQLIHGFPSGSSLHDRRNSFSFPRGSFDAMGSHSSLKVDAALAVSGDRKVSSVILSWPNASAVTYRFHSV